MEEIKSKPKNKIKLFLELGNYNEETNETDWVDTDKFVEKYDSLSCGNGGSWCRLDGNFGKKYKVCTVKMNGKRCYSRNWDRSNIETEHIEKTLSELSINNLKTDSKGNRIKFIKIFGLNDDKTNRAIRKDIVAHYRNMTCVSCGSRSNIEIDHKNDLYNDPRVWDLNTQTLDDFQPLCKHCNDQKRQIVKRMKETNKRYGATNIPMLKCFGIDYIKGDETVDLNDPNWGIGSYWYDPVAFMDGVMDKIKKKKKIIIKKQI